MISFLLRKMWKNKWLMFCLITGNILLVGIVSATPMYSQATLQRILLQNLRQFQREANVHPAMVELSYTFNTLIPEQILPHYRNTLNVLVPEIKESIGLPVLLSLQVNTLNNWHLAPTVLRDAMPRVRNMNLLGVQYYTEHVQLIEGRMPSSVLVEDNVIEALALAATIDSQNLLLDELLSVQNISDGDEAFYVRIVGIYEIAEGSDLFWTALRFNPLNTLLISDPLIHNRFIAYYNNQFRNVAHWYIMLDYTEIMARDAEHFLYTLDAFYTRFTVNTSAWNFHENFSNTLTEHQGQVGALSTTLWVLQVPVYILLAFYIYMVSRQILLLEQNDISILKSRGAGRLQIIGLYTLQSLFVAAMSLPVGVALGVFLCRMLGAGSGFLQLVQRTALPVEITGMALLYAALAMFLSMLTMLIPVIGFSRITIIDHKRKRSKNSMKPLWQRFYLDVLCFGIALYALFTFHNRQEIMAATLRDSANIDPLLFISSSLFIIGSGLLLLRLYPLLVKLIYFIGKRIWSPQAYAALLRVVRSTGEEQFIMIFLIITLAVGTFNAHAARTINTNNDHRIQYLAGADLIFREFWRSNIPHMSGDLPPGLELHVPEQVVYTEPDFARFTHFDEVDALTRVKRGAVQVTQPGSTVDGVQMMAVESNTFGDTLWFRNDLLPIHINYFLNALALAPSGVLLSDNFNTRLEYNIGDMITVRNAHNQRVLLEVAGFVSHWPGFAPVERVRLSTGEWVLEEQFLAVTNLGHLQTLWGVQPYQVWMRTNTPSNQFFYDFQAATGLHIIEFYDSKAALIESRSDPILQGTNGVLTVGFIVTLLVCFVGILLYWMLSIRARVLQFGIFRAMGMRYRQLLGLLFTEQLFVTFAAIAIGALVGEVTARFFVPLIQLSYTAADQVIPLIVVSDVRDYRNLYSVIGFMVVLCLLSLGIYVSKIKIAQTLKLGED